MRVLFKLRRNPRNKQAQAAIYVRVKVNGAHANDFSTFITLLPADWDSAKQRIKGSSQRANDDNLRLEAIRSDITRLHLTYPEHSAQHLADIYTKKAKTSYSFEDLIKLYEEHVATTYSNPGTKKNYTTRINNITTFLEEKKWLKWSIDRINLGHCDEFVRWMKNKKRDQNYIVRHTEIWKNITSDAVRRQILPLDNLASFKLKKHNKINTDHLTRNQLHTLETTAWRPPLQRVADIFLFSCYTGLHYDDSQTLLDADIRSGIDGRQWIFKVRGKYAESNFFDGERVQIVPLHQKAVSILAKYGGAEALPKISNVQYNKTLKQIAFQLDLAFSLSVKIARKTFTDILLNELGISEETVATMLGHSSTRHIRHYARSDERRVAAELTDAKW